MSDPFDWPALAGAESWLGEDLSCEVGIWGKVHALASDYRWIARSGGFGGQLPDLSRRLRMGSEDLGVRTTAWRAPWADATESAGEDYFAIGTYPSRALDAAGRGAILEKRVLHWRRPAPGFPIALAAAAWLPTVAGGDDRCWWDRVGEGDWQRPDYALPLMPDACPRVVIELTALEGVIAAGIDALLAILDQPRLAAVYAGLLAGLRPVMLRGLEQPLPPGVLAALLLPLSPREAARCSLCAWVPATLIDPADLGQNWDLVGARQPGPPQSVAPAHMQRGAALAAALLARDPARAAVERAPLVGVSEALPTPALLAAAPCSGTHPNPRMQLEPVAAASWPGLGYLYEFADRINLRRLDLTRLAQDLTAPAAYPLLPPDEDPAGHPLVGWISALEQRVPDGVDAVEWAFKIDQLRAAALFLLPHPGTLDLVGLPRDPWAPALLAVLAADPGTVGEHLALHAAPALRRMLEHSLAYPEPSLVADIRTWMQRWLAATGSDELTRALGDLL
ncbi:hypothetical protein [uncultured Thiodictyon sp.]|uniref:hypothetical protein n=1 Tax=uncultured Thiodictyon sp. TaxID=1846217 RepID=UPI0025E31ED3|nr:hypothetical protein [uncultured Thiodictyon sp.]